MKNKGIIALLLTLTSMAGLAQTRVWNDVVTGFRTPSIVKVTKVAIYDDRTEVSLHMDFPKQIAGQEWPLATAPMLRAGNKEHAAKDAKGVILGKPCKLKDDGQVDFTLVFDPIPADTRMFSIDDPNAWSLQNVRDGATIPVGINDTYWRDEKTGEWLIGFAPRHVIFGNKVHGIASRSEKNDAYTLTLDDGTRVKVGRLKNGRRTIAVGKAKAATCSPITGTALPDYPTKDLRKGFADNGFRTIDSVTVTGWMKDMPEQAWQKGREFEIGYTNLLTDKQESGYAKMDSLGRFTIRMALPNTSQVFIDWQRTLVSTVLEPGKSYFFLNDHKTGQKLWMGDDVRLQNELIAQPHEWSNTRYEGERGTFDAMKFKLQADSARNVSMEKLGQTIVQHPNISQRYIDFLTGYYLTAQGESMMQARFCAKDMELPEAYMDFVGKEIWQKTGKPYSLYRDFSLFMRDYLDQIARNLPQRNALVEAIKRMERKGDIVLSEHERQTLDSYSEKADKLFDELDKLSKSDDQAKSDALCDAFNESEEVKTVNELTSRIDPQMINSWMRNARLCQQLEILDSLGNDKQMHDIYLARTLCTDINIMRTPLDTANLKFAEEYIETPMAIKTIRELNDKYIAIENMDISKIAKLNKGTDLKGMSDGEKMLRKICEPYKGKLILLDIWGTWCSPCKELLSHSQEEYKRLKDFDLVYLYLCNRSNDESWQNVIKEYNVTGENVVHYNLPDDQQSAIEHYLNIQSFPTYKIIDRDGNVLDIDVNEHNLDDLEKLLEKIK